MKLQRTFNCPPALFGVLPLLNVLFLVLVFYVMSSSFMLQSGIPINLPVTAFTVGPQKNAHIVSLMAGPMEAVYFRDKKLSLAELEDALQNISDPDRSLIIKADRNTAHDIVVQVMNLGLKNGFSVLIASDFEES